jgi:tRNA A37 threonylcarbamoyladenosine synthetase subunit TsaC/SUA5/YrdC
METVYALIADGSSPEAMGRLAGFGGGNTLRSTWHAPGADALIETVGVDHALHRRLIRRLTPGPVRFTIESTQIAAIRSRLGVPAGLFDDGKAIDARVQAHPITAELIASVGLPIAAIGLGAAGLGDGRELPDDLPGVDVAIDDGPTAYGGRSTSVRLLAEGGWRVEREGVYEERYIRKRLERTILFVCTGNTCRSPMAEAIGNHLVAQRDDGIPHADRQRGHVGRRRRPGLARERPRAADARHRARAPPLASADPRPRRRGRAHIHHDRLTPVGGPTDRPVGSPTVPRPSTPKATSTTRSVGPPEVYESTAKRLAELIARTPQGTGTHEDLAISLRPPRRADAVVHLVDR